MRRLDFLSSFSSPPFPWWTEPTSCPRSRRSFSSLEPPKIGCAQAFGLFPLLKFNQRHNLQLCTILAFLGLPAATRVNQASVNCSHLSLNTMQYATHVRYSVRNFYLVSFMHWMSVTGRTRPKTGSKLGQSFPVIMDFLDAESDPGPLALTRLRKIQVSWYLLLSMHLKTLKKCTLID